MKYDKIQQFYDEILKIEIAKGSLNDAFGKIQSEEDLRKFIQDSMIPLARAHGYDFTEEDVMAHEKRNMAKRELTDDELDEVVGGAMPRSLILSLPIMMLLGSVSMGGESASAIGTSGTAISWNNEGSIVETVSQKNKSMGVDEFVKRMEKQKSESVANSEQDATVKEQTEKNTEVSEVENHVADTQSLGSVNTVSPVYDKNGKRVFSNIMRMANAINQNFGDQKIIDIAMLCAHDTCTSEISENSDCSRSGADSAKKAQKVGGIAKKVAVNMAKAQDKDVYKMLDMGARMLDIRVVHENGVWSTCHSFISGRFDKSLKETINFLLDNPGEFVVFHLGTFSSDVSGEKTIDLAKYISTVTVKRNGKSYNLYDFVNYDAEHENLSDITYNKITANGSKGGVYITLDDGGDKVNLGKDKGLEEIKSDEVCPTNGIKYKYMMRHETVFGEWFNSPSTGDILEKASLASKEAKKQYPDRFRRVQYQQSPTSKDVNATFITIAKVITEGSLLKMAERHNYKVINDKRFLENLKNCPVSWFDNITTTYGGFNSRVNEINLYYNIQLNNNSVKGSSYQKISKVSELKDEMKIVLSSGQKNSHYYGNSFSAKKNTNDSDKRGQEWTLVKSGDGWKIRLSDGHYLKRTKTILFRPKLSTTFNENEATIFNLSETSDGKFKLIEGNYSISVNKDSIDLSKGLDKAENFNIYACDVYL